MASIPYSPLSARTVGDLVTEDYRRSAVFKQHGIDFCCGGNRSLEEACASKGVPLDPVVDALQSLAAAPPAGEQQWFDRWEPRHLVEHIVQKHHEYVRQAIPTLRAFTVKVARVHGAAEPALIDISQAFEALAQEMTSHMSAEEEVLFPMITRGEAEDEAGRPIADVIEELEGEHDEAGALMARIRALSDGFAPPEWACNTYRASFALLEEFETDLHAHVHLENNILFPKVIAAAGAG